MQKGTVWYNEKIIKQKEKERAEAELRDEEARKRAYEEMRIRHKKAQSLIKPLLNMIEREEAKRKEFVDNIVSAILVTLFLYVILTCLQKIGVYIHLNRFAVRIQRFICRIKGKRFLLT